MKFRSSLLLVLAFLSTQVLAQDKPRIVVDIPTNQKPWNNINWNESEEQFQFAIVTDRTGGHRPGVFMDAVRKLNLLQPEFVMSVGDLIEGYTKDTTRLNAEWKEFTGFIDNLEMPFFYLPGNHDITNQVMEDKWKELFGVTYYHFVYNNVLFLALNTEDNRRGAGRGTIDDEQYEYIKKVLEDNKDVKWTMVFMHQALWVQKDTKRWKEVEKLLETRKHNVFAGHYHRYWKTVRNNGKYIALATTGGGSRLRGTAYGEFDHVVWVTMTDEGPLLANLLLDGIWDENIVTEEIVDLVRNKPFPVQVEPVYVKDKKVKNLKTTVRVTNNSDHLMKVKIESYVHPSVVYQLEQSEITVQPNDVSTFNLSLSNQQSVDLTNIEPVTIKAEVTYLYEGRADIVFDNNVYFAPMDHKTVHKAEKKIKLDGNLKEWDSEWITINNKTVTGKPFYFKGADDCTVKFATTYDDNNFYIGLDIKDDEVVINEDASHWQQDAIGVGVDARPQHISAINNGEGQYVEWIMYLKAFKEKNPVYNQKALAEGVISEFKKTKNGVQVEVAIPLSELDKMQKGSWTSVRLAIAYIDSDNGGKETNQIWWFPAWNTVNTIPGSGMMFKE